MTTHAFQGGPDALPVAFEAGSKADRASRFWRSVWRLHFYAAIFVAPMLVMLAITGLIIMYTQPINEWLDGGMTRVVDTPAHVGLEQQKQAAAARFPFLSVQGVNTGRDGGVATTFVMGGDDKSATREVYVNPHTGEVTGSKLQGNDLVGLANKLHGTFNNEERTLKMPSLKGFFLGGDEKFVEVPLGDMLIEIMACWGLALAASGLYLWWPRKRQVGKALFVPRLGKRGRARWRDLHAIPGLVLSVMLIFFITTGLPWSAFWGENFRDAAFKVTPNTEGPDRANPATPKSTLAKVGDVDRAGNRIAWAVVGSAIPLSSESSDAHHDEGGGTTSVVSAEPLPAMVSLDVVERAAQEQGMHPGYTIAFPSNEKAKDGSTEYGAFSLANYWPSRVQEEQTVYLDQFSGKTLEVLPATHYGALPWAVSFGIQTHMGTEFGLVNRILMTTACLLVLWSVFTAFVMWWKRRPTGSAGFPRRPYDSKMQRNLAIIALVLALIYPLWGLSVLFVLAVDHFVIRNVGPLRRLFGMRRVQAPPSGVA
jgi:uncharacterized iron-regulated membrane protein